MKPVDTLHQSLAGLELIGCSTLNVHETLPGRDISLAWEGMFTPTRLRIRRNFNQHGRDFGIGGVRVNDGLPGGGCRRAQKRSDLDLLFYNPRHRSTARELAPSSESSREELSLKPSYAFSAVIDCRDLEAFGLKMAMAFVQDIVQGSSRARHRQRRRTECPELRIMNDGIPFPAPSKDAKSPLTEFENLVRKRRATRRFLHQPVDRELIERLLRTAQWAPSGYNLQPTRFIVIADPSIRSRVRRACMNQQPLEEAPVLIVFAGDHRAFDLFPETLEADLAGGAITAEYAGFLRKMVPLMFRQGPFGLNWFWKATLIPLARVFVPIPQIMAVHKRFWLAKQVMLCAMNFMLAAEEAGLGTLPMEGFDSGRLRRVLDLPRSWEPILVVPVGRAQPGLAKKTRLPLERVMLWR
jgi:nitroreductase